MGKKGEGGGNGERRGGKGRGVRRKEKEKEETGRMEMGHSSLCIYKQPKTLYFFPKLHSTHRYW